MVSPVRVGVLVAVILMIVPVTAAGQASYAVDAGYSTPVYLGGTMTIKIGVTNQASLVARVSRLDVNFDWYATYSGDVPQILQPGQRYEWTFPDIPVPQATWSGKHSFDTFTSVAWAESSGGWGKDFTSTFTTDYAVQEPPPPSTVQTQVEWCVNNQCAPLSPSAPVTLTQGPVPTPTPTDQGGWETAALVLVVILVAGLVVVMGVRTQKPSPPATSVPVSGRCPQCGSSNPPENQFCGKCGQKLS